MAIITLVCFTLAKPKQCLGGYLLYEAARQAFAIDVGFPLL